MSNEPRAGRSFTSRLVAFRQCASEAGMETPDILVIGAGIIGCTLARELARISRKVVVLDRRTAGAGASSAAAGLLAPALSTSAVGPFADLCFQSADLYDSWVAELHA